MINQGSGFKGLGLRALRYDPTGRVQGFAKLVLFASLVESTERVRLVTLVLLVKLVKIQNRPNQ